MPAARAISTLWSATFVDPPIAIATVSALRSDAGVTMSRGLMPFLRHRHEAVDELRRETRARRRGSSDGGATMCSGSMPSTAMNDLHRVVGEHAAAAALAGAGVERHARAPRRVGIARDLERGDEVDALAGLGIDARA